MDYQNNENEINSKIDIGNIYAAGIALKNAAYALIIILISGIISILVSTTSGDIATKRNTIIFLGIFNLVCIIVIIYKLYEAGDNLENSVQ